MKNNHVVIIAAGASKRIARLTKHKPKSFLEIEGKRVIDYHLDTLHRRGINDIIFVNHMKTSLNLLNI